jgi:hypothetical protein
MSKFLHRKSYETLQERIVSYIKDFLARNPSSLTMPLAELRSHYLIMTDGSTFEAALDGLHQAGRLYFKDAGVGLAGYEIGLSLQERELAAKIEGEFKMAGIHSPLEEDVKDKLGIREQTFQKVI